MQKVFKIAKIIDSFTVVINAGNNHGIQEKQRFLIYSLDGEEIFDPDTNKSLGNLEVIKGTAIVKFVQENMATIESDTYRKPTQMEKNIKSFSGISIISSSYLDNDRVLAPFKDPQVGDLVKPI